MTEESLFHEALAMAPAERAAFLQRTCAAQPQLRVAVEALLAAHQAPMNMLDRPADPDLLPTSDLTPPLGDADVLNASYAMREAKAVHGQVIAGRYTLLEKIGEGGMGEVWVAKQTEPVKRQVALKLIKAGTDSKAMLVRFEQERQALAIMDHPNIARVLDGGVTPAGQPFFAMELVKGVPITQYCDANRLTPRQRLELFVPVCQAIQHAHQKGIIHRDIKPSNVMVALYDDKPVPKVIDFGVAKATGAALTDQSLYTAFGGIIGTPEYMSPEQASLNNLDIDTRSDVYSLGVLLYELLAGSPPFRRRELEAAGVLEILRVIREDDPPRPSTKLSTADALPTLSANRNTEPRKLTGILRNELDWIVMKALEKDRARRYETANGFAADIQRFLIGETVNAHPPSSTYRLRKFLRKHRGPAVATALVALAVIAGLIGTSLGLVSANRARTAEAVQRTIAETEAARAQKAEADILADYRASTDDAIKHLIGAKPQLGAHEKAYLEKALERWQAFAARQGDDRQSRAIRAEGHFRVAGIWEKLGATEKALEEYKIARETQRTLVDESPNDLTPSTILGDIHNRYANLLDKAGKHEAAKKEHLDALSLRQTLVERSPESAQYRVNLATTHNNLGGMLGSLGKLDDARRHYLAARETLNDPLRKWADAPEILDTLAFNHNALGNLYSDLAKNEDARIEYSAARDIRKRLSANPATTPDQWLELARVHTNLANRLVNLHRLEEAGREFLASLEIKNKLSEQYPAIPEYRYHLAISHNDFGGLLISSQKPNEARKEFLTGLELRKKLVEQYPANPEYRQDLAQSHYNVGFIATLLKNPAEAQVNFDASRRIRSKLVEEFPLVPAYRRDLAQTIASLGHLRYKAGDHEGARGEYRAAMEHQKKLVEISPKSPEFAVELGGSYCNYGITLGIANQHAQSLEWFNRAIETMAPIAVREPTMTSVRHFLRNSYSSRAQAYDQLRKFDLAIKDWTLAVDYSPTAEKPLYQAGRIASRLQAGLAAEALAEVEVLAFPKPGSEPLQLEPEMWYNFACIYAAARTTPAAKATECADRAIELLRRAVKSGYRDKKSIADNPVFSALRDRADFKKLLESFK